MIAVIQRISSGNVVVDGNVVAECGIGLYVLVGVTHEDTEEDVNLLADKIAKLRVFTDENGKMNLSAADVDGGFMVVPNFTLYGSYRKGNRPDYMNAESPERACELYEYFVSLLRQEIKVETGVFGAHMALSIENDGPITIVMDSEVLRKKGK